MSRTDWEREFRDCGALWTHDGNPKRPFARLTSGLISDGFFNGGRVAEESPGELMNGSRQLLYRFQLKMREEIAEVIFDSPNRIRVIGAEYGGIALATIIAGMGRYKSAFAQKQHDGSLAFLRADIQPEERFLLVEDTITTGETLVKPRDAAIRVSPGCTFFSCALALCNRSGWPDAWIGTPIFSLIQPRFTEWRDGENPYTRDGMEPVPAVRPKENWEALTGSYS